MIPAIQREALSVLTELCDLSDDVRLGQLVALLELLGKDQTGRTLWDIEDDQFLTALYHHRAQLLARLPESQRQATQSGGSSSAIAKP